MPHKTGISNILLGAILVASVSAAYADDAPTLHPTPWPIWHWRNHQPRRSDITREQSRKIDRLYMQIEKEDPGLIPPASRRKAN
jgi:hypothetical protein